jgi:YHYH protein
MKRINILTLASALIALFSFNSCAKNDTAASVSITTLTCASATFSATPTIATVYSGTATVPYVGGNGVTYSAGTAISSIGVTGLTATLSAGTLASGAGNLTFNIAGTPASSGVASFAISFGGQSCSLALTVSATTTNELAIYQKIYAASSITSDGTYVIIKTTGEPDHKSIYYPTTNSLYETFSGTTTYAGTAYVFKKNPNAIAAFNYTFKIPLNPKVATNHVATPLGAMGVSLNGVPFYNQYAGPSQPLTGEFVSFDQFSGHPTGNNNYHYHVEPKHLTTVKATKSSLLGFLLDGFPVYGPEENGAAVTNTMLDAYHGHTHATTDYPNGIYHYHITDADPFINGSGFYGTPGTVTQ